MATHSARREQFARASIRDVELTGVGLYANFSVPNDAPAVAPARLIGGDVSMEIEGLAHGAGCLICVSGGRLSFLEIYVYGTEEFPELPVARLGQATPVPIESPAA